MAATLQDLTNAVSALNRRLGTAQSLIAQQQTILTALMTRPRTITEEIDRIPGRRIESVFSGEVTFTANDQGKKGNPVTINVSQDGPFIMTHYPMILWRPTAPTTATNFGRWRPVSSFPLPTQQITTDIIDIMYEFFDGGAQRAFQNAPRGPLLSRPDNIVPAAVPTEFAPNATIQVIPTYLDFNWNGEVAPTEGTLHVDLIGYRIVNL